MRVCICMCMCMYVWAHAILCMCGHMYICVCACMCIHVCIAWLPWHQLPLHCPGYSGRAVAGLRPTSHPQTAAVISRQDAYPLLLLSPLQQRTACSLPVVRVLSDMVSGCSRCVVCVQPGVCHTEVLVCRNRSDVGTATATDAQVAISFVILPWVEQPHSPGNEAVQALVQCNQCNRARPCLGRAHLCLYMLAVTAWCYLVFGGALGFLLFYPTAMS
jgi:hypothetical protein